MNYLFFIITILNTMTGVIAANLVLSIHHDILVMAIGNAKVILTRQKCSNKHYPSRFYFPCNNNYLAQEQLFLPVNDRLIKAEYDKCLAIYRAVGDKENAFSDCEEPYYQVIKTIYNCKTNFNGEVYVDFDPQSRINDYIYNAQSYKCVSPNEENKIFKELEIKWIYDEKILEQYRKL